MTNSVAETLAELRECYHAAFNEKLVDRGADKLIAGDRLLLSMIDDARNGRLRRIVAIEGETIGARIKSTRENLKMTQRDLLFAIGRPMGDQSWLSKVESNERELPISVFKRTATALGVLLDELVP